ncbi:MAG: serine/threonine protein kinase [Myxococcales bacterium]|nr:serine/threonine protein kinase [Myxococcales bacterium]
MKGIAADALHDEELERTRRFLRIGWLVAACAIVAAWRLPGNRELALVLAIAILATTVASMLVYRTLYRTNRYRQTTMTALALACSGCGFLANMYAGIYTAAPIIVALGIYFFCRTENRAAAYAVFVFSAGSHLVFAILVLARVLDDNGFAPPRSTLSIEGRIAGQFGVQFGYALAFWLARSTRAASLRSMVELHRATKIAGMRLAQVDEARDDLDRALKIGGPGRFTGTVVGSWELGNVLGRGGMGEVYEAKHVDTAAPAAVKLLRREMMVDRHHVERFLREVLAVSALESPHVVRVLEAAGPDDAVAFLAMERLRGETLGAVLREAGTLDRETLLELTRQLAMVLDLARETGVVHRDLKPHNVFRSIDGTWKLLDFGVAVLGDHTGTLTQGGVIGTPGYMAPEQARGESVDHRADLYALGALLYRCVTGRMPFTGKDTPAMLYAMVHNMPIRPGAIVPVSRDVERFFAIALAKRRTERFQTAVELHAALIAAFANELSAAHRVAADALTRQRPWREIDESPTRPLA